MEIVNKQVIKSEETADRIVQGLMNQYLARSQKDETLMTDVTEFLADSFAQIMSDTMSTMTEEAMKISKFYQQEILTRMEDGSNPSRKMAEWMEEHGCTVKLDEASVASLAKYFAAGADELLSRLITSTHERLRSDKKMKADFAEVIASYHNVASDASIRSQTALFDEICKYLGEDSKITSEELAAMIENSGDGETDFDHDGIREFQDRIKEKLMKRREVRNG